jgi:hypothetical protein
MRRAHGSIGTRGACDTPDADGVGDQSQASTRNARRGDWYRSLFTKTAGFGIGALPNMLMSIRGVALTKPVPPMGTD